MPRKLLLVILSGVLLLHGFILAKTPGHEAGFIEIPPVTYLLHNGDYLHQEALTTSRAYFFYSFHQGLESTSATPIFLFFNGGPAAATSSGLMGFNIGPYTLDTTSLKPPENYIPNQNDWRELGHLLFVDARQTGFSYHVMAGVENTDARLAEFNADNFNAYIDAADFIRVLLRFYDRHPDLRKNPVVIVGESYGGKRATFMLWELLNFHRLKSRTAYFQDPLLYNEIAAHFQSLYSDLDLNRPAPMVARQFNRQILIQPLLNARNYTMQAGILLNSSASPLYKIAAETGVPFIPVSGGWWSKQFDHAQQYIKAVHRDPYCIGKPEDWSTGYFNLASKLLQTRENLETVLGVDVTKLDRLYAHNRLDAYRIVNADDQTELTPLFPGLTGLFAPGMLKPGSVGQSLTTDLDTFFGQLEWWDCRHIPFNERANKAFNRSHLFWLNQKPGPWDDNDSEKCIANLMYVRTLITNAEDDVVVFSKAIPLSFIFCPNVREVEQFDEQSANSLPFFRIRLYSPGPLRQTQVDVAFPFYAHAAHPVSLTHPGQFFADVQLWLSAETNQGKQE